jgi:hypothetical protein
MNTTLLNKMILPAALGLLIAGGAAACWIYEMWSLSVMRVEAKYTDVIPPIAVPKPTP